MELNGISAFGFGYCVWIGFYDVSSCRSIRILAVLYSDGDIIVKHGIILSLGLTCEVNQCGSAPSSLQIELLQTTIRLGLK